MSITTTSVEASRESAAPGRMAARQCEREGCLSIAAEHGALCAYHLMMERRALGLCPNCGGRRERIAVINELTGKQRLSSPGREPCWQMRCLDCGRPQRPFAGREEAS